MEATAYEESIFEEEEIPVVYATFSQRFGAVFIDGLILIPFTLVNNYNLIAWKNVPALIACSSIILLYQPLFEYKFAATIGKKALGIVVTNNAFKKPDFKNAFLRNIFETCFTIVNFGMLCYSFIEFNNGSESILQRTFADRQSYSSVSLLYGIIILGVYLVEIIMLLSDPQKRALHDRIGKTFVILK